MNIIYADDEAEILDIVCQELRSNGHTAVGLHTSQLIDFQTRLTFMLEEGFNPDVMIFGGHNILRDSTGRALLDMDAFTIHNWFENIEQAANLQNCRVILLSGDEELRSNARQHPEWGMDVVVAKDDPNFLSQLRTALEN